MSRGSVPDWGGSPPSPDSGTLAPPVCGSCSFNMCAPKFAGGGKEYEGPGVGGF